MANRHTHKKLRAEIRARMVAAGESYQQARAHVLSRTTSADGIRTDLVAFSYFGLPGTLATIERSGVAFAVVIPSSQLWGRGYPHPFPMPMVRAALRPRGVQ
jgi:hypothetical protein